MFLNIELAISVLANCWLVWQTNKLTRWNSRKAKSSFPSKISLRQLVLCRKAEVSSLWKNIFHQSAFRDDINFFLLSLFYPSIFPITESDTFSFVTWFMRFSNENRRRKTPQCETASRCIGAKATKWAKVWQKWDWIWLVFLGPPPPPKHTYATPHGRLLLDRHDGRSRDGHLQGAMNKYFHKLKIVSNQFQLIPKLTNFGSLWDGRKSKTNKNWTDSLLEIYYGSKCLNFRVIIGMKQFWKESVPLPF
jgi:hypothetical protein